MRFDRFLFGSLVSGVAWGVLAALIGSILFNTIPWGGVVASPLIGLAMGVANRSVLRLGFLRKAMFAAISLFIAVALFGLATGLGVLLGGSASGSSSSGVLMEWVRSAVHAVVKTRLWVVLVPLAILNQHVLGVIDRAHDDA